MIKEKFNIEVKASLATSGQIFPYSFYICGKLETELARNFIQIISRFKVCQFDVPKSLGQWTIG